MHNMIRDHYCLVILDVISLWCCRPVWALVKGPLGAAPPGLEFVHTGLGSVPSGLVSPDRGSPRS